MPLELLKPSKRREALMTDISKCLNGCDKQSSCYRWTAPSDGVYQAYTDFKPDDSGICENYWDREKDDAK